MKTLKLSKAERECIERAIRWYISDLDHTIAQLERIGNEARGMKQERKEYKELKRKFL